MLGGCRCSRSTRSRATDALRARRRAGRQRDRHDRHLHDGEPVVRQLPRLARARRRVPRTAAGRSTAPTFAVNGHSFQQFPTPTARPVDTYRRVLYPRRRPVARRADTPTRATAGRRVAPSATAASSPRAATTTSSPSATSRTKTCRSTTQLARRFVVCDDWHCSVLGPTYPNREYLLSGQSGGNKTNAFPTGDGWQWQNIVERLVARRRDRGGVLPGPPADRAVGLAHGCRTSAGSPTTSRTRRPGRCRRSRSSRPVSSATSRTDDHPHGDPRAAQQFVRDTFAAFARSPQWRNGLFVLTYDEWGGFFDHVAPPHLPDDRANPIDADDFSQAGFRVPTILASPRGAPGRGRSRAVRPHVGAALPRMALPRCAAARQRRQCVVVVDDARSQRRATPASC